jgi:hypothetical protein
MLKLLIVATLIFISSASTAIPSNSKFSKSFDSKSKQVEEKRIVVLSLFGFVGQHAKTLLSNLTNLDGIHDAENKNYIVKVVDTSSLKELLSFEGGDVAIGYIKPSTKLIDSSSYDIFFSSLNAILDGASSRNRNPSTISLKVLIDDAEIKNEKISSDLETSIKQIVKLSPAHSYIKVPYILS